MTLEEYNSYCGSLPHAEHAVQWRGAHVWKIGGKMFAICMQGDDTLQFTFKATDVGYEVMRDMPGLRPAPYLASRGMKWIQHYEAPGLDDEGLKDHFKVSYDMAIERLTKKKRTELNLM